MKHSRWVGKLWSPLLGATLLASLSVTGAGASSAASSNGTTSVRTITAFRHLSAMPAGNSKAAYTPETSGAVFGGGAAAGAVNRSHSRRPTALKGPAAASVAVPVVTPTAIVTTSGAVRSFTGVTDYQQRYVASGGNQFTITPPDQGLCVGNGFVVETVNDTIRVFDTTGNALSNPIGLNAFYGYPPEINRTTGQRGPEPTDPSCYYDPQYGKWFHVALTLEVDPITGALTLFNHLDIAVSATSNPLNGWVFYHIAAQDDGTQGTQKHKSCPCIGDFPHIGADANGFFITTNEYPFSSAPGKFGNNFNGAQIYAMSKFALSQNAVKVKVVQIAGPTLAGGIPSFTLWPNEVPGIAYDSGNNGTEWFIQSTAAAEALGTGMSANLGVWRLSNTVSLATAHPHLQLANVTIASEAYGVPPESEQKVGPTPLKDCLVSACLPGFGPSRSEVQTSLDSSDSRILTNWLAGGKLYGALGTIASVNGSYKAGIAFFVINTAATLSAVSIANQGYVAVDGNVTYPTFATLANGTGAMAFSLMGASWFPSAAYMTVAATGPTGPVQVVRTGAGPDDEFCGYLWYNCGQTVTPSIRPRWGDYGAAAVDGTHVWIASELIDQTCNITQWMADPTCGGTRAQVGNWATRITQVS